MPKQPAKNRCSTPSRSTYWFFRKATTAWAMVRRRVDSRMEMSSFSETAVLVHKRHHFVIRRHEIGAAVPGHDDGPARIAQARRPVPVPAPQVAEQEPRRERIPRAENVGDLHRETGDVDRRGCLCRAAEMHPRSERDAFFDPRP